MSIEAKAHRSGNSPERKLAGAEVLAGVEACRNRSSPERKPAKAEVLAGFS